MIHWSSHLVRHTCNVNVIPSLPEKKKAYDVLYSFELMPVGLFARQCKRKCSVVQLNKKKMGTNWLNNSAE